MTGPVIGRHRPAKKGYVSKPSIAREAAAEAGDKPRDRACMRCGKSFESRGKHNRLCGPCRLLA